MDHLHYHKFQNDCFCLILSGAIGSIFMLIDILWEAETEENKLYRSFYYLVFPLGSITIRIILLVIFIFISSKNSVQVGTLPNICFWPSLLVLIAVSYFTILAVLVNFISDHPITTINIIPAAILLKSEGVNLGIIIIYTLGIFYSVVKEKRDT
jgi:hypothetical protein